jgi:anti-anti-sigma factor
VKIDVARDGDSAGLRLEGRLDREAAEHLSHTLETLVQEGVRRMAVDLTRVSYVSSAATRVLARWQEELAVLRGEVRLAPTPPEAVRGMLITAGWDPRFEAGSPPGASALRQSTWYSRSGSITRGHYQMAACVPEGSMICRLHGRPEGLGPAAIGPEHCTVVAFASDTLGLGLGAIGRAYEDCSARFGELVGAAGCVACFPTDGARMADYLLDAGAEPPMAVLASGLTCQGGFSRMVRFSTQADADAVPVSELSGVCLEAVGGEAVALVIAGETAGLSGARLRRSPAGAPVQFEIPAVRDWVSFAPERTYAAGTALIVGVVARRPQPALAAHLRPLGESGTLFGHLHAVVFSYRPLPQRTVELADLLKGLFEQHELRDVLHLVWDDRGESAVTESALLRGVGWVAPITALT